MPEIPTVKITILRLAQFFLVIDVRLPRLELGTSTLSVSRSNQLSYNRTKWRLGDSNSWPSECKSDALPTELSPQAFERPFYTSRPNLTVEREKEADLSQP